MRPSVIRLLLIAALPVLAACDLAQVASTATTVLQTAEAVLASASPGVQPSWAPTPSGSPAVPIPSTSAAADSREQTVYNLLMQYRKEQGLPSIPLSTSLTQVARLHVADLLAHPPDGDTCNLHSWSVNGPWTAVCYTDDHAEAGKMWAKPKELTAYPGNGYEIAYWSTQCTAEGAIAGWKKSSGHNAVMVNQGSWGSHPWNAVGVGINDQYAVVWFGEQADR
jgi:uncharacterized protein YkwD